MSTRADRVARRAAEKLLREQNRAADVLAERRAQQLAQQQQPIQPVQPVQPVQPTPPSQPIQQVQPLYPNYQVPVPVLPGLQQVPAQEGRLDMDQIQYTILPGMELSREYSVPWPINAFFRTSSIIIEGSMGNVAKNSLLRSGLNIFSGKLQGISIKRVSRRQRTFNLVRYGIDPVLRYDADGITTRENYVRRVIEPRRDSDVPDLTDEEIRKNHTYTIAQGDFVFTNKQLKHFNNCYYLIYFAWRISLTTLRWWFFMSHFLPLLPQRDFSTKMVVRMLLPVANHLSLWPPGSGLLQATIGMVTQFLGVILIGQELHTKIFAYCPLWSWLAFDLVATLFTLAYPNRFNFGTSFVWDIFGLGIHPVGLVAKIFIAQVFKYKEIAGSINTSQYPQEPSHTPSNSQQAVPRTPSPELTRTLFVPRQTEVSRIALTDSVFTNVLSPVRNWT